MADRLLISAAFRIGTVFESIAHMDLVACPYIHRSHARSADDSSTLQPSKTGRAANAGRWNAAVGMKDSRDASIGSRGGTREESNLEAFALRGSALVGLLRRAAGRCPTFDSNASRWNHEA